MADSLYLSLWFPGFEPEEMLPRLAAVLRQFPFSAKEPGVTYVSVQPVDWTEQSVLERRFTPSATPEEAADAVGDLVHDDYAIAFETYWDLWSPDDQGAWTQRPSKVLFIAHGKQFDEGAYTESGHIQIDFGLDYAFLHEEVELDSETAQKVKYNVAKLVAFTQALEKNVNLTGRVLWSESDENLAQKLISRLQRVQ